MVSQELAEWWERSASAATAAVLPRALRASHFLYRTFLRQQEWALSMLSNGGFEQRIVEPVESRLDKVLTEARGVDSFQGSLRRFRNRELAVIALRDIAGWASVDDTLTALTALAEAACDAALLFAATALQRIYGQPRGADGSIAAPIILGLGKLGGRELNFSSDIDVIFAYTADGRTDGPRRIENTEYFGRLARETTRLLSVITEDGFVFRVDTMLRPFGSAGAAALSTDAMEQYYQSHGREWERYALIKARAVAGDRSAGASLIQALQPFVYRHYLDFTALRAMRQLKGAIDEAARRRGAESDIKLGPGGIRELEFIVQLFQLVRGGSDARLRSPFLRQVLDAIATMGLLPASQVHVLNAAYAFLRRCENALQLYDDAQTHRLPQDQDGWLILCAALDIESPSVLQKTVNDVREDVRKQFEAIFASPPRSASVIDEASYGTLWNADLESLEALLKREGYRTDPKAVALQLIDLRHSRLVRSLNESTFASLSAAVTLLVLDAVTQDEPETALSRALDIVSAIGGRATYFSLLQESALARAQLLRLVASSPRISALIAQTPALLDTLLDARLADETPDQTALTGELARRSAGVDEVDTEATMALLRNYRQEMVLRIAAADLVGGLSVVQVSDRLTWLAEAILSKALDDARLQLATRYGQLLRDDGSQAPFTIIGYGKLGSIELGYASDLDLVFVYDVASLEAETVGGQRSLSAAEYFARFGQRIVHLLSTMTSAGRVYEIDLQLRPSGESGLVVSSFNGWARYQRDAAWTWEHQALLRARPVAGDKTLSEAIASVRREVLTRPRDVLTLRREVREMRERMRAGLEQHVTDRWDVKQGVGGLIDIEFLVQYLVLGNAASFPELVVYTDNWRQLEGLRSAGIVRPSEAMALIECGRSYRNWIHRRTLQAADNLAKAGSFPSERAKVRRLWNKHLEAD